jgi:hypothetical protein
MYRSPGYNVEATELRTDIKNLGYSDMVKNLDKTFEYGLNYTVSGKSFGGIDLTQGDNFFIKSGLCDSVDSEDKCKGQQKYTYVRNIPIGKIPPFALSFVDSTGCNLTGLTEMRGVFPGLIEDVYDINPVEMTTGVMGMGNLGSKVCKKMKLPVGYKIYDKSKNNNTWKFEERCTAGHSNMISTSDPILNNEIRKQNRNIENAALPAAKQFENFTNNAISFDNTVPSLIHCMFLIFFSLILLVFIKS